jgi:hypothetical protein
MMSVRCGAGVMGQTSLRTGVHVRLWGMRRGQRRTSAAIALALCIMSVCSFAAGGVARAATASAGLPDKRNYELVSIPGSGEPYLPPTPIGIGYPAASFRARLPFRAASNGGAIAYVAEPSVAGGTGQTGPGLGNQWLATRTSAGWLAEDITPPPNETAMYESFSSDLTTAIYEGGTTALTSAVEAGCASLYARTGVGFSPLFTGGVAPHSCGHPLFAGASQDQSLYAIQSEAALTPQSEEAAEPPPGHGGRHDPVASNGQVCMFACNLYVAGTGGLQTVNVLAGEPVPSATFGGYATGQDELTNFSNAISTDGSRIFWTDTQEGPNFEHVYVFENGATNVPVSGAEPAEYWTASSDGHYAFYTEVGALWRFDTATDTRVQIAPTSAEVQGVVGTNATGADGAYLYFVANGVLTTEPNSHGEQAAAGSCPAEGGECNLYVLDNGTLKFVARFSSLDNELHSAQGGGAKGTSSNWRANLGERLAQLTPDGQHLLFQSVRPLTGYDSSFQGTPEPSVFVYDAESAQLACASCSPTGSAPSIEEEESRISKLPISSEAYTYMHRWISDNGARVFFDSAQPLSSTDTNELQDVYEWERVAAPGEPDNTCTAQLASAGTGGCTFLISGGTGKYDAFLIDADATGENVFFEHVGALGQLSAPADHNELYDARTNGGFPTVSTGCDAVSCTPTPPPAATPPLPATSAFTGIGNFPPEPPAIKKRKSLTRHQRLALALKRCHKDKRKTKRRSCERQARKRYGPAKTTRDRASKSEVDGDRRAHS